MTDITWNLKFLSQPYVASVQPPAPDTNVRIRSGTIHLGSFGSVGNSKFTTAESYEPFLHGGGGGVGLTGRRGLVGLQVTFAGTPLFTGYLDATARPLGGGTFEFDARDVGCLLQERAVTPKVAPVNQTVGAFITALLNDAGLPINNIASPVNPNGTPITMGTYYGNSKGSHFFSRPEPAWGLVQRFAKDCGFVAYFLPTGAFYFGPRNRGQQSGGGLATKALTWSASGASDFLHNGLHIHHEMQRHAAFMVVVNSSNKKSTKPIVGSCVYVNPQLAFDASTQIATDGLPKTAPNAGMYVGLSITDAQSIYGDLPIYDHYVSGLDQAQANMRALGTAREIAAQEVVITGKIVGTQLLQEGQPISISGTNDPLVAGETFVVVHGTYELNVESGGGFTQDFTAWKADELQVSGIEGVASPQTDPYTTPTKASLNQ